MKKVDLLLSLAGFQLAVSLSAPHEYHRYVIIGAGPGGIQLAHYLDSAGRDYLVLDKAAEAGSFFRQFPRWRQLDSTNKRATGKWDFEFNQRHDWNSLLPDPSTSSHAGLREAFNYSVVPCLTHDAATLTYGVAAGSKRGDKLGAPGTRGPGVVPSCYTADYSSTNPRFGITSIGRRLQFREWSSDYYPHADKMLDYLQFWASAEAPRGSVLGPHSRLAALPRHALNIRLNSTVAKVRRAAGWSKFSSQGLSAAARGVSRFRVELASGQVLECTYLIVAGGFQKLATAEGTNVAELAENYWTHSTDVEKYVNKSVLILGHDNEAFEIASNVLEVASRVNLVGRAEERVQLSWETHYPGDVRMMHAKLLETHSLNSMDGVAEISTKNVHLARDNATGQYVVSDKFAPCTLDGLGRANQPCAWSQKYDFVISVPGWHFDDSIFDAEVRPERHTDGKHPAISGKYESTNVPGMYFAGALMHGHDYKKAAGGFVHGFRYLVRALHRILEEEEQAAHTAFEVQSAAAGTSDVHVSADAQTTNDLSLPHPQAASADFTSWPRHYTRGLRHLAASLLRRINNAASVYNMAEHVGDVMVLPPLALGQTRGFTTVGPWAALQDPASFFDPAVAEPYLPQVRPATHAGEPVHRVRWNADEVLNVALRGAYLEEVPVKLIPEKVRLWQEQTVGAMKAGGSSVGEFQKHGYTTSSVGGVEYLVLTLEYGSDTKAPHSSATVQSEGSRDSVSPLLANVSLRTPEASHSLHPIIRYYNTALDAKLPSAELHIIQESSFEWTSFVAHVLPLTRFLQEVAASRVTVVTTIANVLTDAAERSPDPQHQTNGALPFHQSQRAENIATEVLRLLHRRPKKADKHSRFVHHLLQSPTCQLWYEGARVQGGEGWFNRLSINATNHILHHGPRMLLLHFVDTIPAAPTAEEEEAHRDFRRRMRSSTSLTPELLAVNTGTVPSGMQPQLSEEQVKEEEANEQYLQKFYKDTTTSVPGLTVVRVNVRTGLGRMLSEDHGVTAIPTFRVVDTYRGVMELTSKDYTSIPRDLETLLGTHEASRAALQKGDDSFIFPTFTMAMVRGQEPNPFELKARQLAADTKTTGSSVDGVDDTSVENGASESEYGLDAEAPPSRMSITEVDPQAGGRPRAGRSASGSHDGAPARSHAGASTGVGSEFDEDAAAYESGREQRTDTFTAAAVEVEVDLDENDEQVEGEGDSGGRVEQHQHQQQRTKQQQRGKARAPSRRPPPRRTAAIKRPGSNRVE